MWGVAFSLVPLLVAKVVAARSHRASQALLCALGIAIYVLSFTLVAVNIAVHFLRAASVDKPPFWISWAFVFAALLSAGIRFAGRAKPGERHSNMDAASAAKPARNDALAAGDCLVTLVQVEQQSQNAKILRFRLPMGCRLEARPGQFLTFEWFIDGKAVYRSYSICSSPTQSAYIEIMPKLMANGYVSRFLNDHASPGLMVKARGPYGHFFFDENKHERIVPIAAGSGITPMISILRYMRDLYIPAHCTLIYCVRSGEDLVFHAELLALVEQLRSFRYLPVVSKATSEWNGWNGRLRREILAGEIEKPLESTYFLCGPPGFMQLARALLEEMSVEPSRILQESFGGEGAKNKAPFSQPGSVTVRFNRSGVSINVAPDRTLLEIAEANGVLVPFGCRQGNCGTCMTRLLGGDVQMDRAYALSDELRSQGVYSAVCEQTAQPHNP